MRRSQVRKLQHIRRIQPGPTVGLSDLQRTDFYGDIHRTRHSGRCLALQLCGLQHHDIGGIGGAEAHPSIGSEARAGDGDQCPASRRTCVGLDAIEPQLRGRRQHKA